MSVPQSFQKLLARIAPTAGEEARARRHAETIRIRLATSFALKKFLIAEAFLVERSYTTLATLTSLR